MSTTVNPQQSKPPASVGRGAAGVHAPGRAPIKPATLRRGDRWWLLPLVTVLFLLSFVVYSTWRAFENAYYYAAPYLSPMYSPCLATSCTPGSADFGTPVQNLDWLIFGKTLSPALLILVFPLGYRFTCYYYRKAYYRSFWLSPPGCAIAEPHRKYTGESRLPLILQNAHRWFFTIGLLFNVILTYDLVIAFRNPEGQWGHMGMGTLVLLISTALLWFYSLSCHACRHIVGGRLKHFSKHPVRYRMWTIVSRLNSKHSMFAWISLAAVALADFYVREVAVGAIPDIRFF